MLRNMVVYHVRKPTNVLFNISVGCCSEYLTTALFIEDVDNIFVSVNGGMHVDPVKILRCPLSDNSPHIDPWSKAHMGINSWSFNKYGEPTFLLSPPSQNEWLIGITAAQHVWRTVKEARFKCLQTLNMN
jgi:hypothetical protein